MLLHGSFAATYYMWLSSAIAAAAGWLAGWTISCMMGCKIWALFADQRRREWQWHTWLRVMSFVLPWHAYLSASICIVLSHHLLWHFLACLHTGVRWIPQSTEGANMVWCMHGLVAQQWQPWAASCLHLTPDDLLAEVVDACQLSMQDIWIIYGLQCIVKQIKLMHRNRFIQKFKLVEKKKLPVCVPRFSLQ